MIPTRRLTPIFLLVTLTIMTACSHIFSQEQSGAAKHPEALPEGRPVCTECHDGNLKQALKPYSAFNHTETFVKEHRFAAGRDAMVCEVCHAPSFCTGCHAKQSEIKPSVMLGNRPDRELIHRGDYLTLHRIEGKVDPTGCYRCHGRGNNAQCLGCHR